MYDEANWPDQMTAKERMRALAQGKPLDRLPCNFFMSDHVANLIGAKVSELHLSAEKLVEGHVTAHHIYDTEGVSVGPGLGGFAEALGSKLFFPDHGSPHVQEFAIKKKEDLDRLSVPDPAKAGRFPIILEAAEILAHKLGDKIPVTVSIIGPFSTAGNVRGTEILLRDLYQDPDYAHRLLRLVTDTTIAFIKEAAKKDVIFSVGDPTSSGTLISPKQYRQFAFPYLKEVIDAIKATGRPAPTLHICGNTRKIWTDMADAGAGVLSLDDVIDLEDAKRAVGDRVILMGNVRPTATMYLGTPQQVIENAIECIRKAYDSPKGYILALGCGLPIDTQPENLHALRYAAKKYGRFPLEIDRLHVAN
ncbi:uroporphyrinogen decarboxylase family protein [Heliophilum fasciatum]|uniref:Uroporphyrinogen decarboxylase n=1 Tax=Heliophilum fasciatum TaxID=35700 RepID=A0A4R2RQL5_9FIRM|nr:uroporphyrinogen decarboxylase family protein [Heliophilum fasciatum]MCW2277692.1 uroporphyrinogen decarboxylase [Heliophilum fasciatum]TCP65039.1 uroporphyrinogen decarboxylase [Heliophilum fasciatum]